MALTFNFQVRASDFGGKAFRAVEVTADGSSMTIFAASIELYTIDSAIISPRDDLSSAASIDLASLADAAGVTSATTIAGVAVGDFPMTTLSVDCDDVVMTAYVQAATKVETRTQNEAGGAKDLGDSVRRIRVVRHIGLSVLSGKYIVFQPALQSGDKFVVWAIGT